METHLPSAEGAVLRFFRFSKGMSEGELADREGVAPHTVGRWENGDFPLPRERLAEILDRHLNVSCEAMETALLAHRLGNLPEEPGGPAALPPEERRLLDRAAAAGGRAGAEAARRELTRTRLRERAAQDVQWAAERWARLRKLPAKKQEQIAAKVLQGDERSWALAVRISEASEAAAAHRAQEALRLARLGVRIARGVPAEPGAERWHLLLLGYCEPFEANALRVGGDFPAAREVFASADDHWARGEGGDPAGLLDATRRLDLKASLLQYDGKPAEALKLLEQALQGARTDQARGRLLIKKATCLEIAGEYEAAIEVLCQAEPLIETAREPRLPCVLWFNRTVYYAHLDRYEEAERLLPRVEALVADLQTELDRVRLVWLQGRIHAGLGRREEAVAALAQVRQYFLTEKIAYDFALVSVELATIYLEQGLTRLVKELAEEMLWIFEGQGVHQEALAALALFCHAAREEKAQADWTRRLVKYLYRAQYNPSLRFEP